jgi:lipopolysaccharide transport system ATP-binding protein
MICGTLNPTSGSVHTSGRIAALLELGSGFNPEFSGRENVYMNASVLGLDKKEIDDRFSEIAGFADIGEFIEQPVKNYSSGMVVRLAFAVQAMIDPDIFVVDEALAVGDEKFQRKCFARLEELKSRGTSILFVSHSAASIIEFCDRTLLLDKGNRLMFGNSSESVRAYQKLIYATDADYPILVDRYRLADASGLTLGVEELERANVLTPDNDLSLETKTVELFDPGLVPETTEAYESHGAEIASVAIFDADGRKVNILSSGVSYEFVVSGAFTENHPGVYWGMHIRNISGATVTGQRYPEEGKYIANIAGDSRFAIKFNFKMHLLPGVYFVGCGVWSSGEQNCAHRILDALMFRVAPVEKLKSFGYVDCFAGEPALELT